MRAAVIAMADLGRCARMQYHARALADSGVDVHFVGLEGTALPKFVSDHPRITVHRIEPATSRFRHASGIVYSGFATGDAVRLGWRLWRQLRSLRHIELVLVQNPPAFPTLEVTRLALRRKGVRLVIDWHNLGYSLLQRRLGRWHPAVRIARWFERRHARRVDASLTVSRGMAAFLETRFAANRVQVLYDRPASVFVQMDRGARDRFRQGLFGRMGVVGGPTGFIVCPSSWTEDEDFDVVIEAVVRLEERIRGWEASNPGRRFPQLIILVTGDGQRRAEFERRFAGLPARRIQLRARWLEPEEYPLVVGSADIGLCLHRSTSGLDIPMKVADLVGAGVPVCAIDYGATLAERVRHGDNGLLFSTARQLCDLLFELFDSYPSDQTMLERLRRGARRSARPTWEEGWRRDALDLLLPGGRNA
ncbi:MAG: glycosyltransferase [Vicinamibacterales bacterium]